jgi:hypothetical protein
MIHSIYQMFDKSTLDLLDMKLFAVGNADDKVVFQNMHLVFLMLLLNHFYQKQLMESIKYHSNIGFRGNIPKVENTVI